MPSYPIRIGSQHQAVLADEKFEADDQERVDDKAAIGRAFKPAQQGPPFGCPSGCSSGAGVIHGVLAPNFLRQLDDQAEFGFFVVDRQLVAELALEKEDVLPFFSRQPFPLDGESNEEEIASRSGQGSERCRPDSNR